MIGCYPIGVPLFYSLQLWQQRHHLERLRRFQIEKEDIENEKKARRNTISELTITEFERSELMRLLEEAEVERINKKYIHIDRTLPTAVKKLTSGLSYQTYWFEVFECVRKIMLVGIPVIFPPGTLEQRTLGLIICFFTACLIAGIEPYADKENNLVAMLCQFMIFFCIIAGMVLQVQAGSVVIDIALCGIVGSLLFLVVFLEWLGGRTTSYALKQVIGVEPYKDDAGNPKPRVPSRFDPIKDCLASIYLKMTKGVYRGGIQKLDKAFGIADLDSQVMEERAARKDKHPELEARHRMNSWKADEELMESDFAAELTNLDEDKEMTLDKKVERMLTRVGGAGGARGEGGGGSGGGGGGPRGPPPPGGRKPPPPGGGGARSGGGGGAGAWDGGPLGMVEVDAFLHPERVGIEIAIGDLKRSASVAAKRAAKSLSNLVAATKGQMEADLKKLAADWPVVTPRGRHLTERYTATGKAADSQESLQGSSTEVFEAQRELRGIAFISGAEYRDDPKVRGPTKPENAVEWKELVQKVVNGTLATAHSLRLLQKVLDSFPEDNDTTDVLQAMPQSHPHRKLVTELGLAAAATSSALRNLLSLAVAAGASPDVAPWSNYVQVQSDLDKKIANVVTAPSKAAKLTQNDETESEDSSRSVQLQSSAGLVSGGDSFRTNKSGRMGDELEPSAESERSDPPSFRGSSRRRVSINERLAAARTAAQGKSEAGDGKDSKGSFLAPARLPPHTGLVSPSAKDAAAAAEGGFWCSPGSGSSWWSSVAPPQEDKDPFPPSSSSDMLIEEKGDKLSERSIGFDEGSASRMRSPPQRADKREMLQAFGSKLASVESPPSDRIRRKSSESPASGGTGGSRSLPGSRKSVGFSASDEGNDESPRPGMGRRDADAPLSRSAALLASGGSGISLSAIRKGVKQTGSTPPALLGDKDEPGRKQYRV